MDKRVPVEGRKHTLGHGDVVIAAITSCTNTSNPTVMIAAGLLARKAVAKGLTVKPWVKTSLAPGSQVVAEYYEKSGLQKSLDALGFQSRRLRLHHLYRQLRAAAGGDFRGDQRQRHSGRRGALRQSKLRGPRQRRCARQLSRVAAAGGRLCDRRLDCRSTSPRRRLAPTRRARRSICATSGRPAARSRRSSTKASTSRCSRASMQRVQGRRQLAQDRGQGRAHLQNGTIVPPTSRTRVLRRHAEAQPADRRHRRRPRARPVPRFDHDRPHLAGGLHQGNKSGRRIPARPPGSAKGLQPIRHAAAAITR